MTEPAFATFMQHVLTEILHELKSVRKELHDLRRTAPPTPDPSRKRKRPGPTPPCTLCRLSRTQCIATSPNEACSRCILKQVECFDDEAGDPPRVRHPPEDGDEHESDAEADAHAQPQAPIVWQAYPTGFPPTPVKRERVPKACAECHARKRKCGPNCATLRVNGASSTRPSPAKPPSPSRGREPCTDCRARKRRCIHNPDGTLTPGKTDENDDAPGEEVAVTDTEREPEHAATSSVRHTPSRSRSPQPNGWHYRPAPPPHPPQPWGYEHRPGYPPHGHHGHHSHPHGPFVHDRPPYHHPPPPMHPHPHPHPHARLPPAPDMRHPTCKDCHARGVPCTCSPPLAAEPKADTPTAPAGRKGRACLACRKLKMRCVAPNEEGGPDERCQRCDRAGLECVYVDRKRRGPGGIGSLPMDEAARKKLKREGGESEVSVEMTVGGDDAARVLESFADDEDTSARV